MRLNVSTTGDDASTNPDVTKPNKFWRELQRIGKRLTPAHLWRESRRLQHQVKLRYHWLVNPATDYQPVFVLASPRSGSNLVVDYLNHLPNVQSQWEVLCRDMPEGPRKDSVPNEKAIQHIRYSLHMLRAPIRGCKLMLYQMANCKLTPSALETAFPNSKYIVLYRQSLAEQYVSFQSALATQQWVLFKGQTPRRKSLIVDAADLRRYCDVMRDGYRRLFADTALSGRSVILSYEELTEDPASCLLDKICPLLGVKSVEPKSDLCRQNPQPLSEKVTNYAQIAPLADSPVCWQQYHVGARKKRLAA